MFLRSWRLLAKCIRVKCLIIPELSLLYSFPSRSWSCQCLCGFGTVVTRYVILSLEDSMQGDLPMSRFVDVIKRNVVFSCILFCRLVGTCSNLKCNNNQCLLGSLHRYLKQVLRCLNSFQIFNFRDSCIITNMSSHDSCGYAWSQGPLVETTYTHFWLN